MPFPPSVSKASKWKVSIFPPMSREVMLTSILSEMFTSP